MSVKAAFTRGWYAQMMGAAVYTAREVAEREPDLQGEEIGAYLNGVEDALRADRVRLDGFTCGCGALVKDEGERCAECATDAAEAR